METRAKLSHLRISPRKVRLIVDMIRGKKVEEAQSILTFAPQKPAPSLLKLLNSAVANAKDTNDLELCNLYISKIFVDEGNKYKRWMPRARGRATEILKRTSHITIILSEIKPSKKKKIVKKAVKTIKAEEVKEEPQAEEVKKENKQIKEQTTHVPKPKERGGIKRMFRRKSF